MPRKKVAGTPRAEWELHSRDEERAILVQQESAGPTHEPVGETIRERVATGADTATDVERQRCVAIARRWLETSVVVALIGPVSGEAMVAVRTVLRAMADELMFDRPH